MSHRGLYHKLIYDGFLIQSIDHGTKGILPRILMNLLKQRKATGKRATEKKVTLKNGDILTGLMSESDNTTTIGDVTVDNNQIAKIEDKSSLSILD
jgi:hypothetical protein